MDNAADRKQVRAAEKRAKLAETQNREVICGLMSVINGRGWIHDQLERAHIFASPFSSDAAITAFNCGEQNFGLRLLADVMLHAPDQYVLMMQEANVRRTAADTDASTPAERPGESYTNGGDSGYSSYSGDYPGEPESGYSRTDA